MDCAAHGLLQATEVNLLRVCADIPGASASDGRDVVGLLGEGVLGR